MKYFLILLLFSIKTSQSFSQETLIRWTDKEGRKFGISAPSGNMSYGMIPGDRIEYGSQYSDNPGKIIKIGNQYIEYGSKYSDYPGKIIRIGAVIIEYAASYSDDAGKIIKIGGLRINYSSKYSDNPGLITSIEGEVLRGY